MKHEGIGGKYLNRMRDMTGREAEEGLLGVVDSMKKEYRFLLLRHGVPEGLLKNLGERDLPYISFEDSVDMVKAGQPWEDPANPDKDFLRELRIEVADRLDIGRDEKALDKLGIYTAIGSPLDLTHGVDFFVEYEKKKGFLLRVNCDLTKEPDRKEDKGSIVLVDVNKIGDLVSDEKKYLASIQKLAGEIARNFRAQEAGLN